MHEHPIRPLLANDFVEGSCQTGCQGAKRLVWRHDIEVYIGPDREDLEHLIKHARHVENELVHTDKRALQSDIARDLERLERLRDRVKNALDLTPSNAAV